jgi:hypothetical protein
MTYPFRYFDNGEDPSEGHVEAYLPPDDEEPAWWRLVYTDNDAEDMYEEEVRDCIRNYQKNYQVPSHLQRVLEGIPIGLSEGIDEAERESLEDVEEEIQAKPVKKPRTQKQIDAFAKLKGSRTEKRKERKDIKVIKDEEDKKILDLSNACESDEDSENPRQLDSSSMNTIRHHDYHDAMVGEELIPGLLRVEEEGQRNEKKGVENGNLCMIDDTLIGFLEGSGLKDEEDHQYEQDRLEVEVDSSVGDIDDMEVVTDPVYWSNVADSVDDSTNNSSSSDMNAISSTEVLQALHPYLFQPSRWTVTRLNKFFFLRDALGFKIILESVQVHLFDLDDVFNMIILLILLICTISFRLVAISP